MYTLYAVAAPPLFNTRHTCAKVLKRWVREMHPSHVILTSPAQLVSALLSLSLSLSTSATVISSSSSREEGGGGATSRLCRLLCVCMSDGGGKKLALIR